MKKTSTYRSCNVCGKEFGVYNKLQVRCKVCQAKHKQTKPKLYTKACAKCGGQFHPVQKNNQKHCQSCRDSFTCTICGTTKKRTAPYQLYCSDRCSQTAKLIARHGSLNYLEALKRDDFSCRHCGDRTTIGVHHVDGKGVGYPKPERNNSLENLVTLCNRCHKNLHCMTEKILYQRHKDEVLDIFKEFCHST